MLYIASVNDNNDAIVFTETSSVYDRYKANAVQIEAVPNGSGLLKCDGTRVWFEQIPEVPIIEPKLDELSQLRLAIVELDAQREADKAEMQLAIAEAVAAMMGGEA